MKTHVKTIIASILACGMVITLTGCGVFDSFMNDAKGRLIGNGYNITGYDNYGAETLSMKGDRIDLQGDTSTDENGNTTVNSSVITVVIDGKTVESVGDTLIFAQNGLEPAKDFSKDYTNVNSNADGLLTLTSVASPLNYYKNLFGKSRVIVIKSQLGKPITVYTGDNVYCEVPDDLPKTTKCMVDGKALYIHRANYQIIETSLL